MNRRRRDDQAGGALWVLSLLFFVGLASTSSVLAEPAATPTFRQTRDPKIFEFDYRPDESKDVVTGFVTLPNGIGPYRTVIINHSPNGSAAQVAYNYAPKFTERGYATISPNLKYGNKPEESDWGEMFRRLSACVEILQLDERFDGDRIFMFGNGPGAMVALAYAAQTDKLRAVAMTGGGLLPKDDVKYEKISAPFFLVHGANDESVPLAKAMQLKANLERAKKPVEVKVFEDNGHEVVMLKANDVFDAIVGFFGSNTK